MLSFIVTPSFLLFLSTASAMPFESKHVIRAAQPDPKSLSNCNVGYIQVVPSDGGDANAARWVSGAETLVNSKDSATVFRVEKFGEPTLIRKNDDDRFWVVQVNGKQTKPAFSSAYIHNTKLRYADKRTIAGLPPSRISGVVYEEGRIFTVNLVKRTMLVTWTNPKTDGMDAYGGSLPETVTVNAWATGDKLMLDPMYASPHQYAAKWIENPHTSATKRVMLSFIPAATPCDLDSSQGDAGIKDFISGHIMEQAADFIRGITT